MRTPGAVLLLALAIGSGLARAQEPLRNVVFEDGRALRVVDVRFASGTALLRTDAGLEVRVPAASVIAVEPAVDAPPEPDPIAVDEVRAVAAELADETTWRRAAGPFADTIAASADRHGLDRALLAAVAKVESNFDPFALSPKGACGMLQLIPATARRFGVRNVFDPTQNIEGGARYLRWLLDRFSGDVELALAGYNAGEGAVDRHGGVPPYRETRRYVVKVLDHARGDSAQEPGENGVADRK
ncbi:MAG TPA: lytic transglycosylase domain-containing protein [Candidatus Polarisedimenticolaceae bacterium]